MADEIRRVETVEDRPRDTVVVSDNKRSSAPWVILGIIAIILLIAYLWGNPFADKDVDVTPEVNVPQEIDVNVPSPDVNLPDVDVNRQQDAPADNTETTPTQ